ncbi:hypothetical protein ACED29_11155 [Shewanella sp. 5S214]|uniref:hypothetical protein n=1 Tax=Shewanella sp. 5S214 TaxID=3229999 RepID=UPI00352E6D22
MSRNDVLVGMRFTELFNLLTYLEFAIMQFSWLFMLVLLSISSGFLFGFAAYKHGLAVKRWGCVGCILGPLTYPLFSTHKRLADMKVWRYGRYSIEG